MTATPEFGATGETYRKQQAFRRLNARLIEPGSIALMLIGIALLCQPWVMVLHQYSVLVMLVGLIGFNVAVHVPPPDGVRVDEDDTGPVSVSETIRGSSHG